MLTNIYSPLKKEQGFTLLELLVVIIVIGILAAIAIPLFLDQRKLAVDASVKSDVRNTATQVQTWLAANPGTVASDATAYTAAGGKLVATGSNTVGVSVLSDGSYLVCGYVNNAKTFTTANAAYVFDSSTGKFGTGTCTGGIVGGGSSTTPTPTPTPTVAPSITTTSLPDATVGTKYTQTVAATGTPAVKFNATGLPSSLQLDVNTGVITGTPVAADGNKSYTVKVVADNGSATTDSKTYTFSINAIAPTITTTSLPDSSVGTGYSKTLAVDNASGTVSWNLTGALPAGITFDSTTGTFGGTGTYGTDSTHFGTFPLTLTATAGGKTSQSVNLTLRQTEEWQITNAGAEDSSNPGGTWSDYCGGNLSWTTAYHNSGKQALRTDTYSGACAQGLLAWISGNFPKNTRVTMSAYISGTNNVEWTVGGRTNPYNEGFVDNRYTTTGLGNWQKVTATFTAYPQSGTSMTNLGLQVHQPTSGSVAGQTLIMDDLTATVG
jgi:type IV pilus assembly protein PilA